MRVVGGMWDRNRTWQLARLKVRVKAKVKVL
jgi:hypothetical protein